VPKHSELTELLDDLRRIVRALRTSSRAAEQRIGLTGAQLFVLKCLSEEPALSLSRLAARTRTDPSTVSVVVRRLVERGLVRRETSSTDARRAELALTKAGRALLAESPLAAQDRLIAGLESLSSAKRSALASGLRALAVAMRLDEDLPVMFFEDEQNKEKRRDRA
jgi:DNA-binding MarR family transcriptional regulator